MGNGVIGKYGVVQRNVFKDDLENWSIMSLAGRLHKPVEFVGEVQPTWRKLLDANLRYAFSAAHVMAQGTHPIVDELLRRNGLEPERAPQYHRNQGISYLQDSDYDFESYKQIILQNIVSLSYLGDVRTVIGAEAPDKHKRLYQGNRSQMETLYKPFFDEVKTELEGRQLSSLGAYGKVKESPQIFASPSGDHSFPGKIGSLENLRSQLKNTTWGSSTRMLGNQLMLDSPIWNMKYAFQKLGKGAFRRFKR